MTGKTNGAARGKDAARKRTIDYELVGGWLVILWPVILIFAPLLAILIALIAFFVFALFAAIDDLSKKDKPARTVEIIGCIFILAVAIAMAEFETFGMVMLGLMLFGGGCFLAACVTVKTLAVIGEILRGK